MVCFQYAFQQWYVFNMLFSNGMLAICFLTVLDNEEDRSGLYEQYQKKYPNAEAPKRLPLNFTTGMSSILTYHCIKPTCGSYYLGCIMIDCQSYNLQFHF